MSRSVGCWAQPLSAPAAPMPASLRKSRRLKTTPSLMVSSMVTRQAVRDGRVLAVAAVLTLAVAADAPTHLERRVLVDHGHLLDRAVTLLARDPRAHVALVVELDVLGQRVHRYPRNGLPAIPELGQLLDLGPVRDRHLVASHADAHRRDVRHRRLLGPVVAIEAVHAELSGVKIVRELDRL